MGSPNPCCTPGQEISIETPADEGLSLWLCDDVGSSAFRANPYLQERIQGMSPC